MADAPVTIDDCTCISCGYPLTSLSRAGKCPECGTPLTHTASILTNAQQLASAFFHLQRLIALSVILILATPLASPLLLAAPLSVLLGLATLLVVASFARAHLTSTPRLCGYLISLLAVALLQITLPPALLLLYHRMLPVAYATAVLILLNAFVASGLALPVARSIGYERIVHQLRSQRLLLYSCALSAPILLVAFAGYSFESVFIIHFIIVALLGVIALGHTLVALSELTKVLRLHGSDRAVA